MCRSGPCMNGGTCTGNGTLFTCHCSKGYSGNRCQNDPCHSITCTKRGKCTVSGASFKCACNHGYIGTKCERNDPCINGPCQNGGTCHITDENYSCSCPVGYGGNNCQNDPCQPVTCNNGGTCTVNGSSFQCHCPVSYSGSHCENNPCNGVKCHNHGTCMVSGSSHRCQCPPGFKGSRCELTPCSTALCLNGGSCSVTGSTFNCNCLRGYSGIVCETTMTTATTPSSGGTSASSFQSVYISTVTSTKRVTSSQTGVKQLVLLLRASVGEINQSLIKSKLMSKLSKEHQQSFKIHLDLKKVYGNDGEQITQVNIQVTSTRAIKGVDSSLSPASLQQVLPYKVYMGPVRSAPPEKAGTPVGAIVGGVVAAIVVVVIIAAIIFRRHRHTVRGVTISDNTKRTKERYQQRRSAKFVDLDLEQDATFQNPTYQREDQDSLQPIGHQGDMGPSHSSYLSFDTDSGLPDMK